MADRTSKPNESHDNKGKYKRSSNWDTESSFDTVISLEELINRQPFKESSGKEGGSYTAAARIPTWLERKITHLIEIKGSPYQLKGDVVRDAIYLGLRILNSRYKENPDWAVEERMARTMDQVNTLTRWKNKVKSFSEPTAELWIGGDEEQARKAIVDFVGAAVEINDEWLRGKVLSMIKDDRNLMSIVNSCPNAVRNAIYGKDIHKENIHREDNRNA